MLSRKLKALDYTVPDGMVLQDEVVGLIESIFTDLVATTEAYEGLQSKEENTGNELSKAQAQVFPLRKENTRLMRENNQLHLELIKVGELGDSGGGWSDHVRPTFPPPLFPSLFWITIEYIVILLFTSFFHTVHRLTPTPLNSSRMRTARSPSPMSSR